MSKRIIIVDANSLIHRAYHALPRLTTGKGELVNAIYGFLLLFFKSIKEFKPDYIAACFDLPFPTFRHKEFAEYKATRPKTPKELYEQISRIKQILGVFSVPVFEEKGFEADDILATIAKKVEFPKSQLPGDSEALETIILSGDLDILQLVGNNTKVYTMRKGIKDTILYDKKAVFERYGILPDLMPDFKALVGDVSDNIPGVPGIGPKTAESLLQEFGSLEGIYDNSLLSASIKPRIKNLLVENKEQAFLSRKLAQIKKDVPIDFNLKDCEWKQYDEKEVIEILKEFEFYSLINRLPQKEERRSGKLF